MDLKNKIGEQYVGVLVIGDLHSQVYELEQAIDYANENSLFLISLGDLVDSKGDGQPYESVKRTKQLLNTNDVVMTIGNHDDKMYRHSIGNPVKLGADQILTFDQVGKSREADFLTNYQEIITHPNSSYFMHYGKTMFVHAAVHGTMWTFPDTITNGQKARALYGEVDGTRDATGLPVRTYDWVGQIPNGHQAVVGHDRNAMNKQKDVPMIIENPDKGRVFFTDTSCGKGGHLTGTVFLIVNGELVFARFKPFVG